MSDAFAAVDAIFEPVVEGDHVPGIAYGVVVGGELVHASGFGATHANAEAATAPDSDSVFRIASMTKSFTAATTLLLRDEGALHLDEPVGTYVPELAGFKGPTADSPLVTVRHLLTMASGLPTDDPWGDRLQGLPLDRFAELLGGGFSFAWTPGTAFEYSNLGYGILGRVLTNVSGIEYRDLVKSRFLEPLGMRATVYDADEVPPGRLVQGHVRRDDDFVDEPFDGYGALASMGGVLSSISDLTRWVGGFADAFPPRDEPDAGHPLSRATRREMQQVQRAFDPEVTRNGPADEPTLFAGGYGYGLFVTQHLKLGHVVAHSGGYPGFGSHMRWHPASGVGVIALGNRTYAPMSKPAAEALVALVTREVAPIRTVIPWEATTTARADIETLIASWDDDLAARLFSINVDLDDPFGRRRRSFDEAAERLGTLECDDDEPAVADAPSHLVWWMRGERGRLRVEILLNAERPPRVQSLDLRLVPEPPEPVRDIAARVVALLSRADPTMGWPDDLEAPLSDDRSLLAAAAQFGPVTLGPPSEGDGETCATFRLLGDRGELSVKIAIDRASQAITELTLTPEPLTPPVGP
jgi:CubicO group peptidase (beta-lactamase class C family)